MSKEKDLNLTELREAFLEHDREVRVRKLKTACFLIVVLMPAGITLDYIIYPEKLWLFLKLRLLCSLLAALTWGGLALQPIKKHLNIVEIFAISLPAIFISWMIFVTEGAASPYYAGLNLVLIGAGLIMFWTFKQNLLFQIIVIMMYISVSMLNGDIEDTSIFFNNLYFIFLTVIIVVAGSYTHRKLFYREFVHGFQLDKHRTRLEEANRRLVELDQMKSRFFANISHELRTPLTLIQAPLETLRIEKGHLLPIETQSDLDLIQRNVVRLLTLINDLIDLVKLESGKMEVKREPLWVHEFIKELILSIPKMVRGKGLSLDLDIEEMSPVLVDRDKLERILLNLLTNAIKFTPSGGRVEVRIKKNQEDLVLIVKDSGIGIPAKDQDHVFDRFWQGETLSRGNYQGTGIGLSIVKESVETLGGKISLNSERGQGTTMTIHIPAPAVPSPLPSPLGDNGSSDKVGHEGHHGPPAKEKMPDRATIKPPPAKTNPASLSPISSPHYSMTKSWRDGVPRILIVEDEPDMVQFLRSQLDRDFQVLEAVSGEEAIEKAIQSSPDLILLDIMIPGKDGLRVCRELRKTPSACLIPIVILTARADEEAKYEALSCGASDFLTKPFSVTELHIRIWNLIQSYQFQRDLEKQKETVETALKQLKEAELQLVQTEKMASLGKWSAGIIHEVNNPLNFTFSALYMLKQRTNMLPGEEQAGFDETLKDLEEGMVRIKDIVTSLKDFVHPDSSQFDWVSLDEAVNTALKFVKEPWGTKLRVEVNISKDHKVWGNKNALVQVLINLIENAMDTVRRKSFETGQPGIWIKSRLGEGKTLLSIRDNGEGIAPDHIDRIFDPFFTTKDVGEGMGLGLGICYGILKKHGGEISVKSALGEYTEFVIQMPLKRQEQAQRGKLERV